MYLQDLLREVPLRHSAKLQQVLSAAAQPCTGRIANFNASAQQALPDKCLHELFEEQAASHPDARCLLFGAKTLCYGEVNVLADKVAARLAAHSIKPEEVIGVALFRSFELYIALLGVLKAGGCCLALDPDAPQERKALLLASAGTKLILTAGSALGEGLACGLSQDAQPQVRSSLSLSHFMSGVRSKQVT